MARWIQYLQRQARFVVLKNRRLNRACEVACLKTLAQKTQASIEKLGRCRAGRLDRSSTLQPRRVEQLEPRMLFNAVTGVHLFYNESAYDDNNAAITVEDFDAIATDKQALTELEGASFENYSSYYRGINGVMVDVWNRPGWATPITADDFEFRMASGNAVDGDPFQWEDAPPPTQLQVFNDQGVNGADRVVMTWDDDTAVKNGWLQVTVLPNPSTYLDQEEVFYFGSAIGETGNAPDSTRVDGSDYILARRNLHSLLDPAPIDDVYDINRDKKVDGLDLTLIRRGYTSFLTDVPLFTAPMNQPNHLYARVFSPSEIALTWHEHSRRLLAAITRTVLWVNTVKTPGLTM